jgi:formylglycine-generating enzyme
VGAFTNSASFYGTFDQSGNGNQWNDLDGTAGSSRGLQGGGWGNGVFDMSSSRRNSCAASLEVTSTAIRLASPISVPERSIFMMGVAGLACGGYSVWRRRRGFTAARARMAP